MTDEPRRLSFEDARDALMPPGTNKERLWAALKGARVTGGQAPDISAPVPPFMRGAAFTERLPLPAPAEPADPFSAADAASVGLAEMFHGMVAAGIPVASVERILGTMLAVHGGGGKDAPDES